MSDPSLATQATELKSLSNLTTQLMDQLEQIGDVIPQGTELGDAMLSLMDIVIQVDTKIDQTQLAIFCINNKTVRASRRNDEQQAELLQTRRDRCKWEEEKQSMERKIAADDLRIKSLQELNSMLLERNRATTPSSGFCSASHSPRSFQERGEEAASPVAETPAVVQKKKEPPLSVPPPKPERKPSARVINLRKTPEFEGAMFKDSLELHSRKMASSVDLNKKTPTCVDLDSTIHLSDTPEALTDVGCEGPLCSTFNEERSVYHTPSTSKKTRRRSSSLGDVMKKIFTPSRKVKNPILEVIDD